VAHIPRNNTGRLIDPFADLQDVFLSRFVAFVCLTENYGVPAYKQLPEY
jgi:hypothetical protein